ncbi:MAG: protein kinase [Pirellulaceae bacterium]|nr:protein kinase [Pirellulaceae bacterium]
MPAKQIVQCPNCQAKLGVDASWVGRRARCKKCQNEFKISSASMFQPAVDTSVEIEHAETIVGPNIAPRVRESLDIKPVAERFARFELIELIGEGAFGKVYKSRDPILGRLVALKIPAFSAADAKKTARFLDEAKSAAALRHKNVVPVYEAGQFEGRPYIVSEFIEGQTLSKRIAAGAVEYKTVATWIRDLARALAYAHQCGIIHRDVKSENIMLDANDVPFLMDFGLAKRLNEDSTRTLDGTILGTPAYMPPEQARGEQKSIGPHSDQYSLAVVLYELLCRSRPFSGPTHAVIAQVISAEPPLPSAIVKGVPKKLEAICLKAMSKEIANRYNSTTDFAEDLDCFVNGLDPSVCREIKRFKLKPLTRKLLTLMAVACIALVCFAAVLKTWPYQATGSKKYSASQELANQPRGGSIGSRDEQPNEQLPPLADVTPQVTRVDYAAERKAAEWLLSIKADALIRAENETPMGTLLQLQKLPTKSFTIAPSVNLWNRDISDLDLQNIAGCRRLEFLNVSYNPKVTARGIEHLRDCKTLQSLHAFSTAVDDSLYPVLLNWPDLRELRIAYNPALTSKGFSVLGQLKKLNLLDAGFCNLGKDGSIDVNSLGHVAHIGLNNNFTSDFEIIGLENLNSTVTLNLGGNKLSDGILTRLKGLEDLEKLYIYQTQITDKGLMSLVDVRNLQLVDASNTLITNEGAEEFKRMRPEVTVSLGQPTADIEKPNPPNEVSQPRKEPKLDQAAFDALGIRLYGDSTGMRCELNSATITKKMGELLVRIPGLRAIHMNNCTFEDGVPPLPVISSLVHLRVHNCPKIPDDYFDLLPEIESINDINCYQTDITNTHFRKFMELKELRQLRIVGAKHLSKAGISGISKHQGLKELELNQGPEITDELLNEIAQIEPLEKLYLLSLSQSCSSKGLLKLLRLKNLSTLWVGGQPADREFLQGLATLNYLKELYVFHPSLSADDLKQLASSKSIETLILNNMTQLTLQDFQFIQSIPTLKNLSIAAVSLSKAEIQSLKDANPAVTIGGYGPEGR